MDILDYPDDAVFLFGCGLLALGVLGFGTLFAWEWQRKFRPFPSILVGCGWAFFGLMSLPLLLPAFLQFLLLSCLWFWKIRQTWNFKQWFIPGITFSILAWSIGLPVSYWKMERELEPLRKKYPFESMAGRIPRSPRPYPKAILPDEIQATLAALEKDCLVWDGPQSEMNFNTRFLRIIHAKKWREIVGWGISYPQFIDGYLNRANHPTPSVSQPGEPFSDPGNFPIAFRQPDQISDGDFIDMYRKTILAFLHPNDFGYFRDFDHIAGFEPHGFHGLPSSPPAWQIQHLELVSLLLHDKPGVYSSDFLPQMENAGKIPTRVLDRFETMGLDRLSLGEDLVIADVPGGLRMMGSVRNGRQCILCHGGKRGDLLGAFVYSMVKNPK